MPMLNRFLSAVSQRQDVIFALFLILIVCMLILPLPTVIVDTLLAFSIGLSLLILVAATYLRSVLELSTFPAIILISTIFRLALTVSTTRLILTTGEAGHIIEAFGKFLVAGNVVVGLVIFLIIAVVQFIVITKGAERIAEVSARFTLDALPGKQLSIDAEVRNGSLTPEQAKEKRQVLEKESQFFGAMDGAMRFVKGDAIAGLIIIFVNLLGGLLIGMFQKGMRFGEAAQKYSILSIGDGLVAQIPAMFVAIAAGAVVTRVVNEDARDLGADISRQLFAEPRALAIAAGALAIVGLLPGFPTFIFLLLALVMAGAAFLVHRGIQRRSAEKKEAAAAAAKEAARADGESDEPLPDAAPGDLFAITLHPETRKLLAEQQLEPMMRDAAKALRLDVGFRYPTFGFRSDASQPPGEISVDVSDVPVARYAVRPVIAFPAVEADSLRQDGVPFVEDVQPDGAVRLIVKPEDAARIATVKSAPQTPLQILCDDITATMRRNISQGFGVSEASNWLTELQPKLGRLVQDVQQQVPVLRIVDVGRRLLDEGHSLAQPRVVLETLLRNAGQPDTERVIDSVRAALKRQIIHKATGGARDIPIIAISPDVEQRLREASAFGPGALGNREAGPGREILDEVNRLISQAASEGDKPVITASAQGRDTVRSYLTRRGVRVPVVAIDDFDEGVTTRVVGVVSARAFG